MRRGTPRARPPAGPSGRARASAAHAASPAADGGATSASSSATSSASASSSRSARDPLLEHAEPKLLEPMNLVLSEVLELRVGQRRATPERERLAQQLRTLRGLGGARFAHTSLSKRARSSWLAVELEHVPGRPRLEEARRPGACAVARPNSAATSSRFAADALPTAGRRDAPSRRARSPAGATVSGARVGSGRRVAQAFPRRAPRAGRGCGIRALSRL